MSAASVKCTQCGSLYQGFVLVTSLSDVDSRAAVCQVIPVSVLTAFVSGALGLSRYFCK